MANFTRGPGVPAIQPPLHVAAAADLLAQHNDHEALELPGQAEKLLPQGHGVGVVIDIGGHPGHSLDDLGDRHIVPAEQVRMQAHPLGVVDMPGERDPDAHVPSPAKCSKPA